VYPRSVRPSRILTEIREGKVATCAKLNLGEPRIVELAGMVGCSSVWLCNEHVPGEWTTIEHSVRAAKVHDMDVIVRVSKGSYSEYLKPFECDAAGIMVPYVESAEEAQRVVEMCRCHPLGSRPMDGGNVDGSFCGLDAEDYIRYCNEDKFIILQIESPKGVEEVEKIAAVPGYDFLLFGPGDYSHRLGKLGKIHDPEVLAARKRVEAAAMQNGKWGVAVGYPAPAAELLSRGYRIAQITSDVVALRGAFTKAINDFHTGFGVAQSTYSDAR